VKLGKIGGAGVGDDEAAEAAVIRLPERGVDADLGGDAGEEQHLDAAVAEHGFEFGGVEGALAGLVDDGLARDGGEGVDDAVAGLAADEDAAHGAGIADAGAGRAAFDLGGRGVRQVRAMAFAGVDHQHVSGAGGGEHGLAGGDGGGEERDVIAEAFPEAAGLQEIPLHVDDEERAARRGEGEGVGFGRDDRCHGVSLCGAGRERRRGIHRWLSKRGASAIRRQIAFLGGIVA
jgi:hypothetical protein